MLPYEMAAAKSGDSLSFFLSGFFPSLGHVRRYCSMEFYFSDFRYVLSE